MRFYISDISERLHGTLGDLVGIYMGMKIYYHQNSPLDSFYILTLQRFKVKKKWSQNNCYILQK
jgi:hypothetical protein